MINITFTTSNIYEMNDATYEKLIVYLNRNTGGMFDELSEDYWIDVCNLGMVNEFFTTHKREITYRYNDACTVENF